MNTTTSHLDKPASQSAFADLVRTSQPTISRMVRDGLLPRGGTLRDWIQAYVGVLEAEKEALTGPEDDSAEARAARLELTRATTRLKTQQTKMLVREYEANMKSYVDHLLGEVQAVLYREIPTAVVARLLGVIPDQSRRYEAATQFREVVDEAVRRVMQGQFDADGFFLESTTDRA